MVLQRRRLGVLQRRHFRHERDYVHAQRRHHAPAAGHVPVPVTVKYAPEFTGNAAPISAFPDAGSVANWAYAAMSWAVGNGLIKGNGHDNGLDYLDPNGSATRAQTATIIMRYCQLIGA